MGHTNQTANYNLPQFVGTDKPSWLGDINDAFAAIDTAIAAAASEASTADGKADALTTTVSGHTTQIGTLQNTVTTQGNTLNTVTSLIGNGTPTTTDQTIIGAINELHADQGDLDDLQTTDKSSLVAAINEVAQGGGGGGSQILPLMTSNTHSDGTSSGSAHGSPTDYYKTIDGSGSSGDALELASRDEYIQFTFETPSYVDHVSYHGIGFSNTLAADLSVDVSLDGSTWIFGAAQFNPANGAENIFKQFVRETVKAIRVYDHGGVGSVKVYKIEAYN